MPDRTASFSFILEYSTIHGGAQLFVTPDEYAEFKDRPLELVLKKLGVSHADYLGWLDSGGYVRCMANTGAGRRCKQYVPGRLDNPKAWVEVCSVGGYCKVHGG